MSTLHVYCACAWVVLHADQRCHAQLHPDHLHLLHDDYMVQMQSPVKYKPGQEASCTQPGAPSQVHVHACCCSQQRVEQPPRALHAAPVIVMIMHSRGKGMGDPMLCPSCQCLCSLPLHTYSRVLPQQHQRSLSGCCSSEHTVQHRHNLPHLLPSCPHAKTRWHHRLRRHLASSTAPDSAPTQRSAYLLLWKTMHLSDTSCQGRPVKG